MSDPDALHDLLSKGHRAWCEGVADVRAGRTSSQLSIAALACYKAGQPPRLI